MRKRIFAAFVCLCMMMALVPSMAYADDTVTAGLCEHHPQHDDACGYSEGTAEVPCSHEHTEACYALVTNCVHEHTAECYNEGSTEPICGHVCSEESGCITKELNCKHEHDANCGYVPATAGTPCTYDCAICNAQESVDTEAPSDVQPKACTCENLCTDEEINGDCPVCSAEGADLNFCRDEVSMLMSSRAAHSDHPLCGATCDGDCRGSHENVTWEVWNGQAVEDGKSYYLENDVEGGFFRVPEGATVNLCLNGHTLTGNDSVAVSIRGEGATLNLCDCQSGNVITYGNIDETGLWTKSNTAGNCNLNGGVITGANVHGVKIYSTSNFNMYGGNIAGNTSTESFIEKDGGGIYAESSNCVSMYGGSITGNTAPDGDGGGLSFHSGKFSMYGSSRIEENKTKNGGGVYLGTGSESNIYGGYITNNTNTENGGGVYLGTDSESNIYGGYITNNMATENGGGVYMGEEVSLTLQMSSDSISICENTAQNGGGVYESARGTFNMKNLFSDISKNKATSNGGGVYFSSDREHTIMGKISENTAAKNGGGVYVINGSLTAENAEITNNKVERYMEGSFGGGVFLSDSVLTMKTSKISGNKSNWWGGGVYTQGNSRIELIDSHIDGGNDAIYGGGVYARDGNLTITGSGNSSIAGNHAANTGGGICIDTDAQLTLLGEIAITGNSANKSGGVYINEKNLLLSGKPQITGNTNGDLYLRNLSDGNTIIQLIGELEEGTKIGVTMSIPGTFVNNWKEYMEGKAPSVYFEKNNGTGYHIGTDANGNPALITNSYRVQFEANGGEGTMEPQFFTYGISQKLSSNKFIRTEYSFANWNTASDGSGQSYTDGQTVNNLTDVNDGVVTLYAQWTPIYSVTLHANGGIIADGKDVSSYQQGIGAVLPSSDDITRTGYTFGGWYDNEQCDGNAVTEITSEDVGNKVFWAKWIPNSYQVNVTVEPVDGGTVSGEGTYDTDQLVTLTATPNSKYRFSRWEVMSSGTAVQNNTLTFNMPAENVTVKAVFERKSSGGGSVFFWDLKFDTNGGSKIDTVTEWEFSTIDLDEYVPEKEGYKFAGWYADKDFDKKIDEVYLTEDTTVYAKWEKIEEEVPEEPEETEEIKETETISFKDVKESDWFYKAVSYAVENGLMSGMSEDAFAPNTPLTREMLAVVLYNVEGQPESTSVNPFADVKADMWYTDAILWANANGIVVGYDNGAYGVGDLITREQFAAILYRYAQFKGYDVSVGADTNILSYADALIISEYAYPAMQWACGAGIMGGMDDGTLMPQGKATRAEAATMLMNFCEKIVK